MRDFRELGRLADERRLVRCCVRAHRQVSLATSDLGWWPRPVGAAQSRSARISPRVVVARVAGEFARFVDIAIGSVYELESHLYLAIDSGYLPNGRSFRGPLRRISMRLKRMLVRGLAQSLQAAVSLTILIGETAVYVLPSTSVPYLIFRLPSSVFRSGEPLTVGCFRVSWRGASPVWFGASREHGPVWAGGVWLYDLVYQPELGGAVGVVESLLVVGDQLGPPLVGVIRSLDVAPEDRR